MACSPDRWEFCAWEAQIKLELTGIGCGLLEVSGALKIKCFATRVLSNVFDLSVRVRKVRRTVVRIFCPTIIY